MLNHKYENGKRDYYNDVVQYQAFLKKIVEKYYEGYNAKEIGTQEDLIKLSDELKELMDQAKALV